MTHLPPAMNAVDGPLRPLLEVEFEPDVRYAWTDEDGRRMSPIHRDFGKALTWYQNWSDYKDRIDRKEAREADRMRNWTEDWMERQREEMRVKIAEARRNLTLTGKPPVKLHRIVMTTVIDPISDAEATVIEALRVATA